MSNTLEFPSQKLSTSPEGFKKLCEIILREKTPPLVDPMSKKEPFWTIVMPPGHNPDMIKVTLSQWMDTMGRSWPYNNRVKGGSNATAK